ncbi:hypothetical protein RhiirA5_429499 [Rhizophagus irregularis]|uniref:Uncharacterized protein n=1 Tax=Rhizophagus irregularis TaxID=588596 RepID=A0A2N0NYA8_9GLOM|nr:hypothetical protein RhiirA5_429499 [Rhizophagus irregularis]GET53219.1 pogo transposable element with KRAB domain [Rhizophagus irregularis DAOM 181602=DAOM 197198]
MNEIPVWFNIAGNFTINIKGKNCSYLDLNMIINFSFITDRTRLPPICIFKDKQISRSEKTPPGHLKESVKEKFNIDLAVIPDSLISKYQPLMLLLINRLRIIFVKSGIFGYLMRAWKSISDDIIVYSFKKCGISNTLDESEDDVIYEEIDEFLKEIENKRKEKELEIIDINDNDDSE